MKNTIVLMIGIVLLYSGILSITRRDINFANIGLISIGFLMMIYFLWKIEIVSKLVKFRNKSKVKE